MKRGGTFAPARRAPSEVPTETNLFNDLDLF